MIVKLSEGVEVTLKDKLKYGDTLEIQRAMFKGVKVGGADTSFDGENMLESSLKAIELCIIEIKKGEENIVYSREWLNDLDAEDGQLLQDKVNEITTPKKK